MDNARTFGQQATLYAQARPHYPAELFNWIASNSPALKNVWDVGTGNGQAAMSLTQHFETVYASDPDPSQIKNNKNHSQITYDVSDSSNSNLRKNSVDAITVATALHWFDFETFWNEVDRVSRPNAFFVAWTYHIMQCDQSLRTHLIDPILEIVEPYWSYGNRLSWRGYPADEVKMPFKQVSMPEFSCHLLWRPYQVANFAKSWSAHKKARDAGFAKTLEDIELKALKKLGDETRQVTLPIHGIAAHIS